MSDREQLRRILELAAKQQKVDDLSSAEQLLALFANPLLLGAPLDADSAKIIGSYIQANLAGEEQLKDFSLNVIARIPNAMFEKSIVPGKDIILGDLIDLTRYALGVKEWSLGKKINPSENLPLAV